MSSKQSTEYKIGLEREFHRINTDFTLSKENHPLSLGSSYFNPFITTDFAESQTELITDICTDTNEALYELENLIIYAYKNLKHEQFYNFSVPLLSFSNSAKPACFENLKEAHQKRVYRKGLYSRYGKHIQLLTGFHFNFSFAHSFIRDSREAQDNHYLKIARNFMRYGWILLYLFGASPQLPFLKRNFEYACSLRMSSYGYSIPCQRKLNISLNSVQEYQTDLNKALNTPYHPYQNANFTQLNENILQDSSEYYTPIRLKFMNQHIQYLEIRCLDINPLHVSGINVETLDFVKDFLFTLSYMESQPLCNSEMQNLKNNFDIVATQGRDPSAVLTINNETKSISTFCKKLLKKMQWSENILDQAKLPSTILSSYQNDQQIINFLKEQKKNQTSFYQRSVEKSLYTRFDKAKKNSLMRLSKVKNP